MNKFLEPINKYKKRLLISTISSLTGSLALAVVTYFFYPGTYFEKIAFFLLLLCSIFSILIFIGFYSFLKKRFQTDALLNDIYGSTWRNSQYYQRKNHYIEEKLFLCEKLAKKHLVAFLEKSYKDHNAEFNFESSNNGDEINLIIDSGSTLVPLFKFLPQLDLKNGFREKFRIFTNSVAGIEELHKTEGAKLNERDYYLIGGNPLYQYMATTDKDEARTKRNLTNLLNEHKGVTISILTSNWILGGQELTELILCAKGDGHYEFKKAVAELSDYIIVVSPLGKILKMNNVDELNRLNSGEEKYRGIPLQKNRNKIFLLTSFREEESLSPLGQHSKNLENVAQVSQTSSEDLKYSFFKPLYRFQPYGKSLREAFFSEIPHDYMRSDQNFYKGYKYNKPALR